MTDIAELERQLNDLSAEIDSKQAALRKIAAEMDAEQKGIQGLADAVEKKTNLDKEQFLKFFKKPYVIIPKSSSVVYVAVPKFIKNFSVGWLHKETDSFFIYQFDQYSSWLGDAPKELLEEINVKREIDASIDGNVITFQDTSMETVNKTYHKIRDHLSSYSPTEGKGTIKRGHIFDVIAEVVRLGSLPFKPKKVTESDLREPKSTIKLRDYQRKAYDRFMETGAVGVFHPTGAGKTMVALKIMDVLTGPKLVVVPTRTLVDQWKWYIETYIPHAKGEITIKTYQGYRDTGIEFSLVVFDECQRLPADSFSRLAVIPMKYRLGLSASPHREDGRENYIFALTGFPVGLNWQNYMRDVGRKYHPIHVYTCRSETGKLNKLYEVLDSNKKTIIFCDTIELGKRISKELMVPYIYGQTENRLEVLEQNKVVVMSRVGDLGVSVKNLQRIIEIDFLFGSRQQELQRTGRLMHSEEAERHDIIMTDRELESYGKRLWALQEKGFTVKVNPS